MKEKRNFFGSEKLKEFNNLTQKEKDEKYDIAFMNKVVFNKAEWTEFQSLKQKHLAEIHANNDYLAWVYYPSDELIEKTAKEDWPNEAFCWWLIPPQIKEPLLFCNRHIGAHILKLRGFPAIRDVTRYLFRELDYGNGNILPELYDEMLLMPRDVQIEGINFLFQYPFYTVRWYEVLYFMEEVGLKPEDFSEDIQKSIADYVKRKP